MNRYSVVRVILTIIVIAAAAAVRLNGALVPAYAIAFIGILLIPVSSLNFLISKKYDNPLPDAQIIVERFTVKYLLMALLFLLGILLATGRDTYTGIGICAGIVILIPLQIRLYNKQKKKVRDGSVLWDERDVIIAGKAAKTVLQFQLLILPLMYLALQVFSPEAKDIPVIATACIGMLIAFTAGAYYLIYFILRSRSAE